MSFELPNQRPRHTLIRRLMCVALHKWMGYRLKNLPRLVDVLTEK